MASRGSGSWALVEHGIQSRASTVYHFQVLLPNGTATSLTLKDPGEEMPLHEFLHLVRTELEDAPMDGGARRGIDWSGNVYLEDIQDRMIDKKVKFSDFATNSTNILRLQDGEDYVRTFENMWDLTPPTELLQELPAEYSTESALADLVDNSLQALWSNGKNERKLIRITVDKEKIVIFDTGRGMDGSDKNSISKWGTIGSSNHRVFREKGIGGKAPYLVPFFGMFGYGGTIASMHLGRSAIVSSKTKESTKVFSLHLSREALLEKSSSNHSWKTAGGVRDPSEEELKLSRHKSFTQVEIQGLNRYLEAAKLQRFLKDIYFPYIQCDEDNGSMITTTPVQFEVNGVNLAEVQENEVTITNLHSSNGPDFILDVIFSCTSKTAAPNSQAHARIKCVYFPIVKGKESIDSILEQLSENVSGVKESFDKFARVSIRRLGRLLPDARWGPLPFMEPKQSKGKKAELLKRCCKRVKCFVETDAGFHPTLSKTDLAQHDIFTKALRCFDGSSLVGDVIVDARNDGRPLNCTQLEKRYHEWINNMHEKYDMEIDGGNDEHIVIINPSSKERLGISEDVEVIRVYTSVSRKGKTWKRGDHLKIQPGVIARMKSNFYSSKNIIYATLEYVVVEGLTGDICGEARLICRSIEWSREQGCLVEEGPDGMRLNIQESVSFPISMIDTNKCQTMDDDSWRQMLKKKKEKAPACIEVLRNLQGNALEVLPFEELIMAGYKHPREIIAVIRPQYATTCSTSLLDLRNILKDDELEMEMEIIHLPGSKDNRRAKHIYRKLKKPSSRDSINGLYIFQLSEDSSIFTKSGVYQFVFSVRCRDSSIIKHETKITVRPNSNTRSWQLSSGADGSADNAVLDIRLGMPFRCLAARSRDSYGNGIPFLDIHKAAITILDGDDILAQVEDIRVELSSDSLTLHIRDFLFETSKLDMIRPKYEAMLKISLSDDEFSHLCPCKVKPGLPSTINMDMSWEKNLTPGEVIEDVLLEVFDHCGNHVEEGTELVVAIFGMSFVDKHGSVRKVNTEGFIDLRGLLRVVNGFGSQACLTIFYHKKKIFDRTFQIAIRNLKAVKIPQSCPAGTFLENIRFEVSDSDGLIDESIHGPLHTLSIRSNELKLVEGAQYAFERGRCVVSHVPVPREPGTFTIVACHTHFPDLETIIQIPVYALDLVPVKNESEPICSYPISSQNLLGPSQLGSSQSNNFASHIMGEFSDKLGNIDSEICSVEQLIKALYSQKISLEDDILNREVEIGNTAGSAVGAKELTRHKIEEKDGTAAAVLCTLSSGEGYEPGRCFRDDVVGIVALLGTVADSKISRMLSAYLGEDKMLAVVCKTLDAANYFEKYDADGNVDVNFGIHQEAADIGAPIRRRFPIICLDSIRPYNGGLICGSKQKKLAVRFPHSETPKGFCGFAVNMIDLSAENLEMTTGGGFGLRETLFYRLFGELQVYETRDDMRRAIPHLKNGAVSLDGGIVKGDGMLILGYSDPEVTFPVVPRVAPDVPEDSQDDVCTKIKKMHADKEVVKTLEKRIREAEEKLERLAMKRNKKKRKFDEMSELMSQSSQLTQLHPSQ